MSTTAKTAEKEVYFYWNGRLNAWLKLRQRCLQARLCLLLKLHLPRLRINPECSMRVERVKYEPYQFPIAANKKSTVRRFRDNSYGIAKLYEKKEGVPLKRAPLRRFPPYVKPGQLELQKKKKKSPGQKAAKNTKWIASRQHHFNQQISDCVNAIVESVYNVSSNIFETR
uniref:Uncharacterized protein n=1 Tax=Meloidogyne enterolobii TaxID=390850 RepID=A0A6V7WLH5_MELEN|nr:unnamed protein product [Meloidogyne enterolobii]